MTRAIAIYSCQGEAAEELSFQVGAVITKVKPDEEEGDLLDSTNRVGIESSDESNLSEDHLITLTFI